jgi:ABC-type transport system substrate-binding protein
VPVSVPGVGTQLGSYRIEALLGRGGMGVVYRATDLRLGRQVALKLLAPHVTQDQRFRARFLAESRLAASIDHAGIVPIYEAGEVDDHLYIAMRYVEGTDLASLLRAEGGLAPDRAVGLVAQLADALDAAHARGLVHRDVKPSNALIAVEGTAEHVYLADFGLTKHTTTDSRLTATDQLVGTIDYVAPERIRAEQADGRADLYALGCVLFECLTGEVPFPRDSEAAAIYAHLEDEPPRASERRPGLPPALDDVISRALEKEPGDRWQSGAEFVGAARAALPGGVVRRPARLPRRVPRRALVVFALMAVLAILGGLLLARSGKDPTIALADADAVAVIDPGRASLLDDIDVGASPSDVAAGAGAVWVANADGGSVSRIDRRTRTPRQTIPVGAGPIAVAVGAGGVWTANSLDGTVSWISPATNLEVERIPVGNGPTGVCVAGGVVWIAVSDDHAILRFDPVSRRRKTTPLEDMPTQLACGGGFVWASSESAGTVTQISVADGGVVHRIPAGGGASGLAWGAGALWVANTREGTVSRIDPRRGAPTAAIPVGARAGPVHVAVGADGVWVSNEAEGTLARIDPARQAVVDTPLRVGNPPQGLAVVDGSLWVAVRASGAQHRGGTLRITESKGEVFLPGGRLDPAAIFTPEAVHILGLINDGLVTFRRVGGRQGATLVPDLAVSLPTPTDRGRTYAFQLRHGINYSTGAPVRASDFRRQLERVVRKGVAPEGFYGGIRGAKACAARHADCDLSPGIRVDDAAGTITFRLTAADPDFLYKLAQTLAVPVPQGTSVSALRKPLPATGPYQVAELDRKHLRLVRNPRFSPTDGRPAGYADEINFAFDVDRREAIRAVQRGRADLVGTVALSGAPRAQLDAIVTRYAGQLHADVQPLTNFMFLNTRVPPFNRLDARRALNFAVDRRAAVAVHGGDRFAQVTCQILPPNFPGYRPYCPYTTGAGGGGPWAAPDLAQARRLVARSHTRGMAVTVLGIRAGYFAGHARLMRKVLDELGYKGTLRLLPADKYFAYASRNRPQIGHIYFTSDYPAASDFLQGVFSCGAGGLLSGFCDPTSDRLMERAQRLQAENRPSDAAWARAERRVVDQAPVVPLTNGKSLSLVSRRVGSYQYSPQTGVLYDRLWVR